MRPARISSAAIVTLFACLTTACGGSGSEPKVGPPAVVQAVGGASASVTAGAATPLSLTAKVADAAGNAVSGVSVSWSTSSGSITPATSATDGSGQAGAQWTPGNFAGVQAASATVSGAGTATFSATVTAGPLAKLKLVPDTVKLVNAGGTATLSVSATDAFNNPVTATPTFTVLDPLVATVSASGVVTAVASGTTTVRATSGSVSGSAIVIVNLVASANTCSASSAKSLAVGESATLTGADAATLCVQGSMGAEFVAVPFFATGNGGTVAPSLSLTFTPLANAVVSGPPSPDVGSNALLRASVAVGAEREPTRDIAWEAKFRARVRKQLSPLLTSERRRPSGQLGARFDLGISPDVLVGSTMQLNVNVKESCSNVTLVNATVKAVSARAIVVNDDRNPSGASGFTNADFQFFANVFDLQVWPVDTDNFGIPTDIDKNGRVILFFTTAVNALTPSNQNSFVGGFFFGRDIVPKTTPCNQAGTTHYIGSNEAEMFYLLAPDPDGTINKNKRSVSFVKSITTGTVAHEFQHLINFSRHYSNLNLTQFSAFEETFLDEGLSHIAEELNYYAATGRSPRTNIDANTFVSPSDAYLAFGYQNAVRFSDYLKNPDRYPPYSALADTSLAVRGGIWSFLRYATDLRASSVAEKTTWFQLVNPTTDVQGIANLKAVYGSDLLAKMHNWAVANYLDDAGVPSTQPELQHPSWNTRSVETFVNGNIFPLKTQMLIGVPVNLSLADGGAAYLRFGVGAGQFGGATVTGSATLPPSFSITVVRTK